MCWQRHDQFLWSERAERRDRRPAARPRAQRDDASTTLAKRADLRVSDADRQVVIDDLRQHTGDGRLTLDDFEERVEQALRASTGAELQTVTRDLPSLRPAETPRRPGFRLPVRPGVIVLAALLAVLLLSGHWWVLFPLGFFVLGGGPRRHARYAPTHRHDERDDSMTYA